MSHLQLTKTLENEFFEKMEVDIEDNQIDITVLDDSKKIRIFMSHEEFDKLNTVVSDYRKSCELHGVEIK
jgi:hypothetical protein